MNKIMIINGPNLNMVGIREKSIYGEESFDDLIQMIQEAAKERNIEVDCRQSNHEGDLVDWIQEAYFKKFDGVVINPGAYTHTSIALADAVKAITPVPVVEVHISDINTREKFRQISFEGPYCLTQIIGHGFQGYIEGIDSILTALKCRSHS
jgi:3-dehydroquinate dehydratase-2